MGYREEYRRWLENANEEMIEQLREYSEKDIEDSFYHNLQFGTGGLRGIIGAGTNKMNVYTVGKASQGLANYLNKNYRNPIVVIGYDSRIKSEEFAKLTADVLSANGIKVYIWSRLIPVPVVSFATRHLKASAGVMITASHNPAKYNGYKVYGDDGCQITTEAASDIMKEIEKLDIFLDVKKKREEAKVETIKPEVLTAYIEEVKKQSVLYGDPIEKNVAIVYSPLNGTGLEPITRVLKETGFNNVLLVEEQRLPDGEFPTCPYPNPENKETMQLGMEYASRVNADLFLATDPDCDRVGIAVKNADNTYVILSGNETGLLLLDYVCSQKKRHDMMPENPVIIKTIVTTDVGERIASNYGVETINVLTGFKYIGEQIGLLDKKGKVDSYIFGFEESYGYLSGTYARDKDGVNAAYLICEMFCFYKTLGISVLDKLKELYEYYGYCLNTLHSYEFEGTSGGKSMKNIMRYFHDIVGEGYLFGDKKVIEVLDYSTGLKGLPKSDVIKYVLQDNCSVVIRPSGTEPKMKTYICISACSEDVAKKNEKDISEALEKIINSSSIYTNLTV